MTHCRGYTRQVYLPWRMARVQWWVQWLSQSLPVSLAAPPVEDTCTSRSLQFLHSAYMHINTGTIQQTNRAQANAIQYSPDQYAVLYVGWHNYTYINSLPVIAKELMSFLEILCISLQLTLMQVEESFHVKNHVIPSSRFLSLQWYIAGSAHQLVTDKIRDAILTCAV